ncbi:hypothetical protein Tco_1316837 [Tanacetum coccineum]
MKLKSGEVLSGMLWLEGASGWNDRGSRQVGRPWGGPRKGQWHEYMASGREDVNGGKDGWCIDGMSDDVEKKRLKKGVEEAG